MQEQASQELPEGVARRVPAAVALENHNADQDEGRFFDAKRKLLPEPEDGGGISKPAGKGEGG